MKDRVFQTRSFAPCANPAEPDRSKLPSVCERMVITMNFWERITGCDMTKEMRAFESRVKKLPADYQEAWEKINLNLWPHADLTGRNLMPVLDGVLGLLEEAAADGQSAREALGDDIKGFCAALAGEEGAKSYRDKWRAQLNNNIAKKLGK